MGANFILAVQKVPASIEKVWAFYSNPQNLKVITPVAMNFSLLAGDKTQELYPGQIFQYRVRPLFRVPFHWVSEITGVSAPTYFVDKQRKGPFRSWEHQHFFKKVGGGIEIQDIINYETPLWMIGDLANTLFIKKKLRQIFKYRFKKVEEIFGKWPKGQEPAITIRPGHLIQ